MSETLKEITKSFSFGAKVKFVKENIHPDLVGKEFCLLGFNESAFALIEWSNRGGYYFEFYTGSVFDDIETID